MKPSAALARANIHERAAWLLDWISALVQSEAALPAKFSTDISALRRRIAGGEAAELAGVTFDMFVILRLAQLRITDRLNHIILSSSGAKMSQNLAQLFRQEAHRQATVAMDIVDGMLEMPTTYIPDLSEDGGVDRTGLHRLLALLKTEQAKLDSNEATIAVLGAMKAGKSTSINAIVGSEVLPSREQPMTTFPTIVTHVPGEKSGKLSFPLASAFNELSDAVAKAIKELGDDATAEVLSTTAASEALRALAANVVVGDGFVASEARGLDEIRELLTGVNDLTRLARTLDVSDAVVTNALTYDRLPRIEIEFEHLADAGGNFSGVLSLVDTPGPNEFGSNQALKAIAEQQLADASAIILVVEFGQVGSEADAEVKKLLTTLPSGSTERLFTFINKFDAAKKHGDNLSRAERLEAEERRIDEYRTMTAVQIIDTTGEGDLETLKSRTFPTVADMALLSNQARRALRIDGALPVQLAWVENFADRQFPGWEDNPEILCDREQVESAISRGWRQSRFDAPLTSAISYSADNAARLLVSACLDKMRDGMGRVYERLALGRNALEADTAAMIATINDLNADLSNIDRIRKSNKENLEDVGRGLDAKIGEYQKIVSDSISGVIQAYAVAGDAIAAQGQNKKFNERIKQRAAGVIDSITFRNKPSGRRSPISEQLEALLGDNLRTLSLPQVYVTHHPQTGSRSVKMSDGAEARKVADRIYSQFEQLLEDGFLAILTARNAAVSHAISDARDAVRESFEGSWLRVQDRVQSLLAMELPPPELDISVDLSFAMGSSGGVISRRSEWDKDDTVEGAIGRGAAAVFEFFGGESKKWGRIQRDYNYIDLDRIGQDASAKLGEVRQAIRINTQQVLEQLGKAMEQYAEDLTRRVEQVQRYLEEERVAREADVEAYGRLRDELIVLGDQANDLRKEAQVLRMELVQ